MSLQVWLPLNGDLHNQGLNNIQPIGNEITLDNNGKIGKCYSFNGSNSISINKVVLPSQTPNWSFACWFLFTDTTVTSANCFFSERIGTTSTGYSIFIYPSTGRILVDDGVRWNFISSMTFTQDVWYHLVITRSPSEKKLYINGELKNSTNTVGNTSTINTNGCLIGLAQTGTALTTGNQGLVGKLNDVRIYDHCLSQKEIEEISKGLILHYKLDSIINNKIYDCSGYQNNGTIVGSLETTTQSPRYSCAIKFDGVTSCIKIPYNEINPDRIFTVNLWFYKDALGSKSYETLFGGPSGFEMDTRSGSSSTLSLYMASVRGGNAYSPLSLNKWTMITMVRDGTNEFYYVNGDLKKTIEAKSMPSGQYRIGAWASNTGQNYYGEISDFRIYATAFTSTQIKELYNTSATIDNKGNIYARELVEE